MSVLPYCISWCSLPCCQVIAETKAALEAAGINVAALEAAAAAGGAAAARSSVARSSTSLLVKNLPYSADDAELRQLLAGPGGKRSWPWHSWALVN